MLRNKIKQGEWHFCISRSPNRIHRIKLYYIALHFILLYSSRCLLNSILYHCPLKINRTLIRNQIAKLKRFYFVLIWNLKTSMPGTVTVGQTVKHVICGSNDWLILKELKICLSFCMKLLAFCLNENNIKIILRKFYSHKYRKKLKNYYVRKYESKSI